MNYTLIIISTLLVSAFFSGIEIAYLSANKFRIELDNKQGSLAARILSYFIKSPSRFIITILVGINLALVLYGNNMAEVLEPFFKNIIPAKYAGEITILLLQTLVSSLIMLVAGEFIPKVLFRINPNQTLNVFAYIIFAVHVLLFPIVWLILKLTHYILRIALKTDFVEDKPLFGRLDLDHYINELNSSPTAHKSELNSEIQMFQNALDFDRLKVRECMVPRTEIVALDYEDSITDLKNKFIETGLSKILIYRDNIDYIVGFVHSFEMFKKPETISSILLPIALVPESMPARELMTLFSRQRKSVAVIVDEHGLTSGMVTVEDIIEEIFGEIEDEHDTEDLIEKKINDDEYILSGRHEIHYLNTEYKLQLPYGDYETLAGMILHHHEALPSKGEIIVVGDFTFAIQSMQNNRIEQLQLKINRAE
ncbi:MAG: HlyC/CorC family transporter [Bacteroidetes bacterium]|nr:HlyC/CorC family transporter [Bacteroidota bacterium]